MSLGMFFNELSLNSPAPDIETARQWMGALIDTMRVAVQSGVKRELRTDIDLNLTPLTENYPLARWRNDKDVDREQQRFFRVLATHYPAIDDLPEIKEKEYEFEFQFNGKSCKGLGFAYLLEGLAVSFQSAEEWDTNRISVLFNSLDKKGEITSENVSVYHAGKAAHIRELLGWIKERIRREYHDGKDLWNRRTEFFPSLSFCEGTDREIRKLRHSSPLLCQIAKKLFGLDEASEKWKSGPFPELPFKDTPESEATLQNNKFAKMRTSVCPCIGERLFSRHVRVTPGEWRIYFIAEHPEKPVYIGYIGPHLPTVSYA